MTLDVYEHAYFIDYGSARADYIKSFFKNMDWQKVSQNYDKAVQMARIAGSASFALGQARYAPVQDRPLRRAVSMFAAPVPRTAPDGGVRGFGPSRSGRCSVWGDQMATWPATETRGHSHSRRA